LKKDGNSYSDLVGFDYGGTELDEARTFGANEPKELAQESQLGLDEDIERSLGVIAKPNVVVKKGSRDF